MTLQNSNDQGYSNNTDGWSLAGGDTTTRTLTLTGADLSLSLSSLVNGNILQYNGTNFVNVAGTTYGTGSVTSISTGTGLTGGPVTTTGTISISANGVTGALFRQSAPTTLVGNPTAGTANVSDISIGTGLSLPVSGTLALGTSGVTAGTYAFATVVVDALGRVTTATVGTPVTSIITGTGLTGGTITSTGTIAMGTSGVTAGTYGAGTSYPQLVIDALGRVTSATVIALGSIASQGSNNVTITGGTITGLPTPTAASDAATKSYVDNATAGLTAKAAVRVATTGGNLASTYANGTSGVNATLTLTATGVLTIDSTATLLGDRILVKDQTSALQNGIYVVTTAGATGTAAVLTRTTDFNSTSTVFDGAYTVVEEGTINKGTLWLVTFTGDQSYTIGTTAINFLELTVANQTTTLTGDITGVGAGTIATTLATVNANTGTFGSPSIVPVITVNAKGLITAVGTAVTGTGSVTSVATGTGLTGGPVTNTGTISMATSGVTAGTYAFSTVTVDALGRVTAATAGTPVTSVIVTGANGIGVTGGTVTSTGTIALTLGAITPTSVAATGNVTGANLSGTNTGDQVITLSGDITTGAMTTGTFATTLATVNSNVGTFGNTTNIPTITVNAKGLITAISNTAITYGTGSVTSIATGTGLTGGPVTNTGTVSVSTNGISAALFRQSAATTLVGNAGTATANVTDISIGTGLTLPTSGTLAMGTSGVVAGTYNGLVIDALGRVTSATSQSMLWVTISGTTQTAAVNTGYIPNNAALCTITIPATAAVGDIVRVGGRGAGGWKLAQAAGQTIHFGNKDTTTGTAGFISSNQRYNSIEMVCIIANTDYLVLSSVGNMNVN